MADEQDASVAESVEDVQLEKGTNDIPSIAYRESGYNGLKVLGGQVFEDCSHELRWPQAAETYKKMAKDAAISPALELVETMIARVPWDVKIPEGYEDELKSKANYLKQVMNDMDHTWQSMIKQASTFKRYGFAPLEIVLRYRRKDNGSKFDDGLVGVKKLSIRSQDTIDGWYWKNNGRELAGLVQRVVIPDSASPDYGWDFANTTLDSMEGGVRRIPRKKFLLFRNNPLKDSPIGTSPLNGCWQAWKYKTAFQEAEAIGAAQDVNGFKVLYLPPQYMAADASEENQAVFKAYQQAMANMHVAKQSGLILPLLLDDSGKRMFDFEVMSVTGQRSFNTNEIIGRYNAEILTCLFADFLALGQQGGGSFALGETKISIIEMGIQAALDEIKSQLNHQLVRTLFEQNGWDTTVMPEFTYGNVSKESLDEVSKFIQRTAAVSTFPRNRDTINWVMKQADIPYRVPDTMSQDELDTALGQMTSRSGDGMSEGLGNGTGQSNGSSGDNSTSNNENA
jgi:hypothetical protein